MTVDLSDSAGLGKSVHVVWFMLSPSDISATGMLLSCLESEEVVSYILTILFSHLSLHFCISFFVFCGASIACLLCSCRSHNV